MTFLILFKCKILDYVQEYNNFNKIRANLIYSIIKSMPQIFMKLYLFLIKLDLF